MLFCCSRGSLRLFPLSYGAVVFAGSVPFPAGGGQAVLRLVGSGMQYSSGVCHYGDSLVLFTDFTVNPAWTIRLQGEEGPCPYIIAISHRPVTSGFLGNNSHCRLYWIYKVYLVQLIYISSRFIVISVTLQP